MNKVRHCGHRSFSAVLVTVNVNGTNPQVVGPVCFIPYRQLYQSRNNKTIGGGRGQWLGGTMASAEHKPIMGVRGQKPPEAESILVIGCPTEPANLAPLVKFSK